MCTEMFLSLMFKLHKLFIFYFEWLCSIFSSFSPFVVIMRYCHCHVSTGGKLLENVI